MHLMSLMLVVGFVLLVVTAIVGLVVFWSRILASRPARVGLAVVALPVILFCGFGFLATFEGSDASFVAFRVAYGVTALTLCVVSAFLAFGRLRPVMALGASGSH